MSKFKILDDGLIINKISKSFGNKQVVRDVSLNINRGEIVGLLGPNGAGKTTTFYIIVGLLKPDAGSIILDTSDISNLPIYLRGQRGISYLPQEPSIFRGMNVEDNLMSIIEIIEKDKSKHQIILENLLNEFDINHVRKSKSIVLSGGERRRLALARTLASKPNYLLLDEPFAALDVLTIKMLQQIIVNLQSENNISIILCDHQARDLLTCVDIALVLSNCKVIASGAPSQLINNVEAKNAYFGESFKIN